MTGWRIIFMGTPEFACPTLKTLIDRGENIIAVFTQPDRPKGRGQKLQPTPVKELALARSIPVFQPPKVRAPEVVEQIRQLAPDIIVVVAFGQILPKELLDIPPHGCVNVHASLLPRYRGAAPLNWCIVNGDTETGVTTMLMDPGMDTGPMLLKKATPLTDNEDIASLHDRMSVMGGELLAETLDGLKSGKVLPEPQDNSLSCPAPRLKKEDGLIDWSRSAREIHNRVRALSVWPGACTSISNDSGQLKVFRTSVSPLSGDPGTVISADRNGIVVACGEGALTIHELQAPGAKRMDAASFLSGRPLPIGTKLGNSEKS